MSERVCAYCKRPGVLTREHLWPASLHKRLLDANRQSSNAFWLSRLQKEIAGEPQIRDVCAGCNNGVLSELDSYICGLFDRSFVHIPAFGERIAFEYDYHLLTRWLLKMSFNSARIHNAEDSFALEALLPYILGDDSRLGRCVQVYVQLSYPQEVPASALMEDQRPQQPIIFEPMSNRAGHLFFRVPRVGQKLLRCVHLRAFSFYLSFFKPDERRNVMYDFERVFTQTVRGTSRLSPSRPVIQLICNGIGAWDSFDGSRTTKIQFNGNSSR